MAAGVTNEARYRRNRTLCLLRDDHRCRGCGRYEHTLKEAGDWLRTAFERKEKVMGFGHRVYKNGDHRAVILEAELRKLAEEKGEQNLMAIYDAIKEPMLNDKKIFPNVDYPCGLT